MIISAMQPYFLPAIHYFQLIKTSDIFVILDNVNYINRGFINRNYLINPKTNKKELFNISLKNKSQNKLINEIEIFEYSNFLKKIEIYYSKNFNFKKIYNGLLINKIFYKDYVLFIELLKKTIEEICLILKINTKIILASSLKNKNFKGQERIINIVEQLSGTKYVNFIGGSKMYEQKTFEKKNIELYFLKSNLSDVKFKNTEHFITNLSILEILMNFDLKFILNNYLSEFNLQKA